ECYAILAVLRENEIKNDFLEAYTNNDPLTFLNKVKGFLKKEPGLKEDIEQSNIELSVELEKFSDIFISYAKKTTSPKFKIEGVYPDWDFNVIPTEFRALIEEKTGLFCGRSFVFQEFDKFINSHNKGYFTVIGDAGMGKSAIASKYILSRKVPCYFNIATEGKNKPEQFLSNIRQQLIIRYRLPNQENADLRSLLQKASEKLSENQKLIIVVDALDEVEQEGSSNLLDLPKNLPNGVYFLLTRRPYNLENKRLNTSPDTPYKTLDLREKQYQKWNDQDVREYIRLFLEEDQQDQDKLQKWLQDRSISQLTFIEEVAQKSENNFMYLRYVFPAIANGQYDNLELEDFPIGLEEYYYTHWQRMNMEGKNKELEVFVLFILSQSKVAPTSKIITEIVQKKDEFKDIECLEIDKVLDKWVEYLSKEKSQGEIRYRIYHQSFTDFLTKQKELDKNRKIFEEVVISINESEYRNSEISEILQG
ncbi:AAA family ATPase, partial [Crocosphaera sp.]